MALWVFLRCKRKEKHGKPVTADSQARNQRDYRGYHYLYRAVLLALSDEDYLLSITKKMYLDIAAYYGIPVSNVERNLRTVITICWERGNREFLTEIASYPLTFRPSAGEFIDILVAYCREHQISE